MDMDFRGNYQLRLVGCNVCKLGHIFLRLSGSTEKYSFNVVHRCEKSKGIVHVCKYENAFESNIVGGDCTSTGYG